MPIRSINPHNNKLLKSFRVTTPKEINLALTRSQTAFTSWSELSLKERTVFLKRVARVLRDNKETYAKTMTLEMGKPLKQSLAEVEKCAWVCDYYASESATFLTETEIKTDRKRSYVRFDPLGVILAVMPWNYPLWQFFRFMAPALVAGNTILLKHASNVPQSALIIRDVCTKAQLPNGTVEVLLIEARSVEALIADPRVKAVTLTGSTSAGQKVAAIAGAHLKKCVLELGGSDPFIVLKDADLTRAVRAAVQSRTQNAGQSCIAAKRFIVEKPIAEKFTKLFAEHMASVRVGDPLDETVDMGPLARHDLRDELDSLVKKSVALGAKIVTGGKKIPGVGAYYEPTVLTKIKKNMPAYNEEFFGPVASIITARDEEEALTIANDTVFGLGGNIWTKNQKKAERLARKLDAGFVAINGYVKSDPRLPFGGVKMSGYGRELGLFGIREFVNVKTVTIE